AAARWRLPGGPAAAAAARLLDAMAETNERTLAALVAEVFAPSLRERRSDAELVQLVGRMRGDVGAGEVTRYEEARNAEGAVTAVRLRLTRDGRPPALVTLTLEPPARTGVVTRVAGIALEMGD
ncbi:MAG: hypothetical protein AB1635_21660, partial [Acidobacteriota bacterium]